jgi:hypothetical protein
MAAFVALMGSSVCYRGYGFLTVESGDEAVGDVAPLNDKPTAHDGFGKLVQHFGSIRYLPKV